MKELRRVQGTQYYITLPWTWRQGHEITKGDDIEAYYTTNSALVLNPQKRELSSIELDLINLLLNYPSWQISEDTVKALKDIVNKLETS